MISATRTIRPQNLSSINLSSKFRPQKTGQIFWLLFSGQIFRPKLCLQAEIIRPIRPFRPPDVLPQKMNQGLYVEIAELIIR